MTDQIREISQITKVESDFHDLGMYGEYYGLIITFSNGRKWSIRMQEHKFNHLQQAEDSVFEEGERKMEQEQEAHDKYLSENLHDNG